MVAGLYPFPEPWSAVAGTSFQNPGGNSTYILWEMMVVMVLFVQEINVYYAGWCRWHKVDKMG